MKSYFCTNFSKPILFVILSVSLISFKSEYLNAEYLLKELQIDNSTKQQEDDSAIPTNPFELVEIMRRYNSLNDATNPSDALDDALKSFNNLNEE